MPAKREKSRMKPLPIIWRRLVDSKGQTCGRCAATCQALRAAVAQLEEALRPLAIRPSLKIIKIEKKAFEADPSRSNQIWVAGKPIEEWLGARVASSPCCSVCGESECRTLELGSRTFEAIPAELILKAALIAASDLVGLGPLDPAHRPPSRRKPKNLARSPR